MSQAIATGNKNAVKLDGVELPAPGAWTFDVSHSAVAFSVKHLMVSKVRGRFERFDGSIDIAAVPEESSVDVTIDAASFNSNDPKRDEHVRSADFLDVEKYPTLRFRSTRLERTGGSSFKLHGELTIKDVTRPVTLDATYEGAITDPWGNAKAGFSATTEIDREEFGIAWNAALETGGVLVGRKVQIQLEIEALHAQAPAA
jgi:polyisoprenoid-binding protein YceI